LSQRHTAASALALGFVALAPLARAEPELAPTAASPAPAAPQIWLAAFAEGAFGLEGAGFYNQLLGGRFDYRPEPRIALGIGVSYVNLKGPDGRVSNALPFSAFEWRAPLGRQTTLPVRFASGYLPKNGPWLKAAVGLGQPIGELGVMTVELLAPTLWVVGDQAVWSLDASVELAFGL